ncbi:hypothetical protein PIROE2DRAFT_3755 [Piromyces sp. E2]|nr:hypothetical protein PIROE2DRAFT_3755 [Piromyces sp. E2]|eukprot:OUM68466.1 hypothetical protein PIROE2DRAFT_3755 [Piromyces sp. E2]
MTENMNNPFPFNKYKENIFGNVYLANVRNRLRDLENPSPIDCKRWVWELVQNAKDSIVGQKDRVDVDIEIIVKDDLYIFMHNGAPFNMGTLTALLYKYSEGKTNDCESTGRFGTGFLTTHSLSKTVKITSDIIEEGHEKPYGFTVTMFREGEDQELLEGLKKTENSFKVISSEPIGYTTFEYKTTTKRNKEAGRLGIENFKENIASVMLFCPQIHRIQLNDNGEILYLERDTKSILNSVILNSCQKLSLYVKKKEKDNNGKEVEVSSLRKYLYYMVDEYNEKLTEKFGKDRNLRICCAVELDDNDNIITNTSLPCLFCSLPLVGSEAHELPFFMNSPDFEPDSERQALLLDGNDINKFGKISDPGINRMILLRSFSIYREILEYISHSDIKKRYLLTRGLCTTPYVTRFFDSKWYEEMFIKPMRNILLEYPVVWNGSEYKKFTDVFIPIINYNTENDKKKAFNIISQLFHSKVPSYDESINIDKNIWKNDARIKYKNIEDCVKLVTQQENITNLSKLIHDIEIWKWTDDFLQFLKTINSQYLYDYALIPNMNSQFVKLTNRLASSQYVPENMIACLEKLNVHWKDTHIHKNLTNFTTGMDHNVTYAVSKIRECVNSWSDNVFVLMHYIPYNGGKEFKKKREMLYEFCTILWNNKMYQKIDGSDFPEEIWDRVDNMVFNKIIENIQKNNRLGGIYTINFINKFLDYENIPSIFKDCFKNCFNIDINEELIDERITSIKPLQNKNICSYKDTLKKYFTMLETNVNNLNNFRRTTGYSAVKVPLQPPIFTLEQKKSTAKYLIRILPKKGNQIYSKDDVQNRQRDLFELYKIFTGDISTICEIERNDNNFNSIWYYSNKYIFEIIKGVIEQQGTLDALNRRIVRSNDYTLDYLRKFITYSPSGKIIPNQNNKFCDINQLFNEKDWGEKPEQIKDIARYLGYNVKELLVHEGMKNPCPKNMLIKDICNKIDELINEKFNDPKNYQDSNYRKAAKKKAKLLFYRTYTNKEKISYNVIYDESTRKNFADLEKTFNSNELTKMTNNSEVKTLIKKIVKDDSVCRRLNEIEQKYDRKEMEIIVNDPNVEKFIKNEKSRNTYAALEKAYEEEDLLKLSANNDDVKELLKKLVNNEKMLKDFIELSKKYNKIAKPKPSKTENTSNKEGKEKENSSVKEKNKKNVEKVEKMIKNIHITQSQKKNTIAIGTTNDTCN